MCYTLEESEKESEKFGSFFVGSCEILVDNIIWKIYTEIAKKKYKGGIILAKAAE